MTTNQVENDSENSIQSFYKKLITSTVNERYPRYSQEEILKKLEQERVVKLSNFSASTEGILDLSEILEPKSQISMAIENRPASVKHVEKHEFYKSYKHAVLFYITAVDEQKLDKLNNTAYVHDFRSTQFNHDQLFYNQDSDTKPTKFEVGNTVFLKFSKLLTGTVPGTGELRQIKYPIIAVYLKHLGVLEIRLDNALLIYQEDELFYDNQIQFVLSWFREKIGFEISNINLSPVVEFIKKNRKEEVIVEAQSMSLASGGKATLETGIHPDFVLPLLGELQELIKANEVLFDSNTQIKQILEQFISDTESKAELPWITLLWRASKTKVKFKFNYMNKEYTFLQYYGRQSEMEKMNNVTDYIIENRTELDRIREIESAKNTDIPIDNQEL